MSVALPQQIIFENAKQALTTLLKTCPQDGKQWVIDGAALTKFDSSALSVCVSLLRHADKHNTRIEWQQLPTSLQRLISIYGIAELFNLPLHRNEH